jgi:hypothetical protein
LQGIFFAEEGFHHGVVTFDVGDFRFVLRFPVLPGQVLCGRNSRHECRNGRFGKFGIVRWVAIEALHLDDSAVLGVFYARGVVSAAKGALRIVAQFLGSSDFAIEATEQVNEARVIVEVRFRIIGVGEFLEEDLRETGGGGLKTHLGQLGCVVAAQEVQQMILVETMIENGFLFKAPFEVTAGGPIGDVALDEREAALVKGGDDISVRDAVPEHAIDHVALGFWEGSDAAMPADFALFGSIGYSAVRTWRQPMVWRQSWRQPGRKKWAGR